MGLNRRATIIALLVVFVGVLIAFAGLVWLLGMHPGWVLILGGLLGCVFGLTVIDVDDVKDNVTGR